MYVYSDRGLGEFGQLCPYGICGAIAATVELSTAGVYSVLQRQNVIKTGQSLEKTASQEIAVKEGLLQQSLSSQSALEAQSVQQAGVETQNLQKEVIMGSAVAVGLTILLFGVLIINK